MSILPISPETYGSPNNCLSSCCYIALLVHLDIRTSLKSLPMLQASFCRVSGMFQMVTVVKGSIHSLFCISRMVLGTIKLLTGMGWLPISRCLNISMLWMERMKGSLLFPSWIRRLVPVFYEFFQWFDVVVPPNEQFIHLSQPWLGFKWCCPECCSIKVFHSFNFSELWNNSTKLYVHTDVGNNWWQRSSHPSTSSKCCLLGNINWISSNSVNPPLRWPESMSFHLKCPPVVFRWQRPSLLKNINWYTGFLLRSW